LRDLVVAMLTISDNPATDALLDKVGIDAVNANSARLGMAATVNAGDLRTIVNSIGQDAGFADWASMWTWRRSRTPRMSRIRWCAGCSPARP
jgi:beta-lactamase class A